MPEVAPYNFWTADAAVAGVMQQAVQGNVALKSFAARRCNGYRASSAGVVTP